MSSRISTWTYDLNACSDSSWSHNASKAMLIRPRPGSSTASDAVVSGSAGSCASYSDSRATSARIRSTSSGGSSKRSRNAAAACRIRGSRSYMWTASALRSSCSSISCSLAEASTAKAVPRTCISVSYSAMSIMRALCSSTNGASCAACAARSTPWTPRSAHARTDASGSDSAAPKCL